LSDEPTIAHLHFMDHFKITELQFVGDVDLYYATDEFLSNSGILYLSAKEN
jgi:hypothetical protein